MFVCTGNVCRSPMAHYYMQKQVIAMGLGDDFLIESCGTYAVSGEKATQNAQEVMKQFDVSLEKHRATNISETCIEEFDYIFALTENHKQVILSIYPKLLGNVFTLKEFADPNTNYLDIDDPWGYSRDIYQSCAEEIVENVDKVIENLKGCE